MNNFIFIPLVIFLFIALLSLIVSRWLDYIDRRAQKEYQLNRLMLDYVDKQKGNK